MKIKICNSIHTLRKIAALRYQVYHVEQNKTHLEGLDFKSLLLTNNKDFQNSIILYIEQDSNIIGTLRFRHVEFNSYLRDKYHIENCSASIKYSEVDFFVVHNAHRKTQVAPKLACEIYYLGLLKRINICLIEIENHLEGFYERLGFKLIRKVSYEYGLRSQMCLNLMDINYLISKRSPFIKEYNKIQNEVNNSIFIKKNEERFSV